MIALYHKRHGFTLIELLVVLAILATLLTLVVPRYFGSVDKAKEAVLQHNLVSMREVIDKYYGDTGRYPATIDDLVEKRYLRAVPMDPITERNDSWVVIPPEDDEQGGVFDIRSGADGVGHNGAPYNEW